MGVGPSFAGWTPFKIRTQRDKPRVHWCYTATEAFTDPFFHDTIARCLSKPFNQFMDRESSIETLLEWSASQPGIAPTAFIFHGSRCGSTLLAQMAAALPHTLVVSEAPPLDHVLRADVPDETRMDWFRAVISALGQPRRGDERHLFVKLDAWHVFDLDLVQRAFPGVPSLFLYREPADVIASHQRMPGSHMVPGMLGARPIGIDQQTALGLQADAYAGRVLCAFYAAAVNAAALGHVRLINYAQLPEAGVLQLLEWCGLPSSHEARERMEHVCRFDAKTPAAFYAAADRPGPNQRAREIAAQLVDAEYARLEAIRCAPIQAPDAD